MDKTKRGNGNLGLFEIFEMWALGYLWFLMYEQLENLLSVEWLDINLKTINLRAI